MKFFKITIFSCLLLFTFNSLIAQTEVESWDGKIELTGEKLKKEIKIRVPEISKVISVSVSGSVSGGNLKVKLYNPDGAREANLNLCSAGNSKAKGRLSETMEAVPGVWVLKITNDEATGKVNVEVEQN